MKCEHVTIGGMHAIVCGRKSPRKKCACGQPAPLLCDWKIASGQTCDEPLCAAHAQEVAPEKHLCPEHQAAYAAWLERKQAKVEA